MSIINSYTIIDTNIQKNGMRKIINVFVDHLNKEYRRGPMRVPDSHTETEYAALRAQMIAGIDNDNIENEINQFLNQLKSGINPFRDDANNPIDPQYQTRLDAIKSVLKYINKLRGSDLLEYAAGFRFLTNLNQAQVEALGFNFTRYQQWQTYVGNLKAADESQIDIESAE